MSDNNTSQVNHHPVQNGHSVVAIFNAHTEAEEAVKNLQKAGFDMTKLSIIGKDCHAEEHVVGYYNTGDRMGYWASWAHSGAASGGCCSARRFLWCPASARLLSAVLSWGGSSARLRELRWLAG